MATPIEYVAEFPDSPEVLHAILADESYWNARIAAVGGDGATVAFGPDPDGEEFPADWFSVRTTHVIPQDRLPSMVAKMRAGDLVIHRSEHWSPLADGFATGVFTTAVPGTPASLRGDATLEPAAPGQSRVRYSGEAKVNIPFFGAKIESTLSGQVLELLDKERDFTANYLAQR